MGTSELTGKPDKNAGGNCNGLASHPSHFLISDGQKNPCFFAARSEAAIFLLKD